MTPKEQLKLWAGGNSIHNLELNECCPDFSCCYQGVSWGLLRRHQYMMATKDVQESMVLKHVDDHPWIVNPDISGL